MPAADAINLNANTNYKTTVTLYGTWFEEIVDKASGKSENGSGKSVNSSDLNEAAAKARFHGRHREFISHRTLFNMPLVNISLGVDPATGRTSVAKGLIAIGKRAAGIVSIGQFSTGYVSLGQFSAGRVISIGQFSIAPISVGQFGFGAAVVGQMGMAIFGVFQTGIVTHAGIGQSILHLGQLLKNLF